MKQFNVTGMSCAACSARVEKAVGKVEGVTSCSVSLLTNSMGVEGTAEPEAVIKAVEAAGYGASIKGAGRTGQPGNGMGNHTGAEQESGADSGEDVLADRETPVLKRRLLWSLGFLAVLMYVSMGAMMWNWPVPEFFSGNPAAMGLLQLLLTVIVMVINQKFFINGYKSLFHGAPNMDTLVALGSSAAFVYSTYALFVLTDAMVLGDQERMHEYMHEFYFESAAMILTLITVGKMLEARSKGKTTDALKGLMKLAPKTAHVLRDGVEQTVPMEQVLIGDLFVVRPGEQIPVDGVVIEGSSAVNESALTGESIPVDKEAGSTVSAATLNQSGFLTCRATRVGQDTTLSQIIQMVSDAAATKAPIAKVADKVSGVFVPVVITIAVLAAAVWLLAGESAGFALARGISVLVISCPCALGLATPVAIMVGNGVGAKNGIMFKTAVSLEETGKVQIVALDKTGTITKGEPQVTDICPSDGVTEEQLLTFANALEQKSEHPLAKAVLACAAEKNLPSVPVTEFEALPGNGLTGRVAEGMLYGGNERFLSDKVSIPLAIKAKAENFSAHGKTPLFFALNQKLLGVIAVADVMKEDSPQAVKELQNMGIRVVMLTGDNEKTAKAIGAQAGVDEVIAGVLPEGKEKVIRELKQQGRVAMVGDGINDAPALTQADMGIAIGAGTDIAIDAADVVLMKSRLSDVPAAIRLSRATLKNIHQNLFWAFFYNSIGIPLAAGLFIPVLGWELNPMFGAAAMSLSSFCVVTNALRLNLVQIYNTRQDKKIRQKKQPEAVDDRGSRAEAEKSMTESSRREYDAAAMQEIINKNSTIQGGTNMEKTMKIEGMMCGHCEARVKKCLEALPEVVTAVVSHEQGTAVVTLSAEISNDVLKSTVEAQDYTVLSVE
ncbi:MAG: heavy metal translocating P-type ATPase [Lachnospiraceae bacterium]|nr:heavy metal translocating P-type ATPase [Lachnospiraceae bacterium]